MIRIEALNKKKLKAYISSEEFRSHPFIPITSHRAQSHIHNPRADDEDALLLLAYTENDLVGYLGVLADWIFANDGSKHKCGWLSCMWIHPSQRGKGISKKLVRTALEKWNDHILVTEFTGPAKGLYDKIGAFRDLQIRQGLRVYRRLDLAKFLPPKKLVFRKNKWLLHGIDTVANALLDLRFLPFKPARPANITISNKLDDKQAKYIDDHNKKTLFGKSSTDIRWMLTYPWILASENPTAESKRYHFSAIDDSFSFECVSLLNNSDDIVGLLIFAQRGNNLKIPFCHQHEGEIDRIIDTINYFLYTRKINTLTCYQAQINKALKEKIRPALFKKTVQRHFIISKSLDTIDPNKDHHIQDGDADCAFT